MTTLPRRWSRMRWLRMARWCRPAPQKKPVIQNVPGLLSIPFPSSWQVGRRGTGGYAPSVSVVITVTAAL